jgi:hypothetical protein
MKFVTLLLLLGSSLFAQNVVWHDYSLTVKGVTIGATRCVFWFHQSVNPAALAAGFDLEMACYEGNTNVLLAFKRVGNYMDGGYVFGPNNTGYVRVFARKAFDEHDPTVNLIDFQLAARGPTDTTDFLIVQKI